MAGITPEVADKVRLAIGLLNASEWGPDAVSAYLAGCDEPAADLINGLVVVARVALGNIADNHARRIGDLLQTMATRTLTWQ